MSKFCIECESPMRGRADKKFCSDDCRSSFHNRMKRDSNNFMRTVNNTLRRNRRILFDLYNSGETCIDRERLAREGFAFGYYTNERIEKTGGLHRYCYEVGYIENGGKKFNLVKMG